MIAAAPRCRSCCADSRSNREMQEPWAAGCCASDAVPPKKSITALSGWLCVRRLLDDSQEHGQLVAMPLLHLAASLAAHEQQRHVAGDEDVAIAQEAALERGLAAEEEGAVA